MVAAIDGLVGEHRCVLGENIDPRLESAVGRLDGKGPVPHAIPTKAVAAGLQSERLLGLLENPRVGDPPALPKQTDCSGGRLQLRHEYRPVGERAK
jgi:hypothetical protein